MSFCHIFFFHDTATTEIYTLSLHDALPICHLSARCVVPPHDLAGAHVERADRAAGVCDVGDPVGDDRRKLDQRSEEHTSELQSRQYLVCRLLLEKKKKKKQ